MWLYLTVSIHVLSESPLSITSLTVLVATGIVISIIMIIKQEQKRTSTLETTNPNRQFSDPHDYELYFYRLYELIESKAPIAALEF